jgi:transcription elongation factor Elf1
MTPEKKQKEAAAKSHAGKSKEKEIIFTCKHCEKDKPISEMVVINRFSPPLVTCKSCEKTAF